MLTLLLLAGRLAAAPAPAPPPDSVVLSVQPAAVAAGGEAVLRWRVPGAPAAFVSLLGAVAGEGEVSVHPAETTEYTLVAETADGVLVRRVTLAVTGVRGVEFPSEDDPRFRPAGSCDFRSRDRVRALGRIHTILNDSLRMQVREYTLSDLEQHFATLPQLSPTRPRERNVAYRRVSYIVSVPLRSAYRDIVPCSIRALVEYRLAGERTWRPEADAELYAQAGLTLRRRLLDER
jgi:hypothetical protein